MQKPLLDGVAFGAEKLLSLDWTSVSYEQEKARVHVLMTEALFQPGTRARRLQPAIEDVSFMLNRRACRLAYCQLRPPTMKLPKGGCKAALKQRLLGGPKNKTTQFSERTAARPHFGHRSKQSAKLFGIIQAVVPCETECLGSSSASRRAPAMLHFVLPPNSIPERQRTLDLLGQSFCSFCQNVSSRFNLYHCCSGYVT